MAPIYSDLDDTLIHPYERPDGSISITVRPGAGDFLQALSRHGEVGIVSHGVREHVRNALRKIGRQAEHSVVDVIAREDLEPIMEQLEIIETAPGLTAAVRESLYQEIEPLAPSGVLFDDQKVGSWIYELKTAALGIGRDFWIEVPPFRYPERDSRVLEEAYEKFLRRFVQTPSMGRRRSRAG